MSNYDNDEITSEDIGGFISFILLIFIILAVKGVIVYIVYRKCYKNRQSLPVNQVQQAVKVDNIPNTNIQTVQVPPQTYVQDARPTLFRAAPFQMSNMRRSNSDDLERGHGAMVRN